MKRTIFLLILISTLFFSWQCFQLPSEPVAPTWDTQLSIPLVDTIYYLKDALAQNPNIVVSGPAYEYRILNKQFEPAPIGQNLSINPDSVITAEDSVGIMVIQLHQPLAFTATAAQLLDSVPSIPVPIPPVSPRNVPLNIPQITEFEYVHLQTGELSLEVRNSLPIASDLPEGITIRNVTGEIVASFPATTISPNSTWNPNPVSLSDTYIHKDITVTMSFGSPGSGGQKVLVEPDSGLTIKLSITNGLADEVRGTVFNRAQITTDIQPFELDDSTMIQNVRFSGGKIDVMLENKLKVGANIGFQIKQFRNVRTGEPLKFEELVGADSTYTQQYNLEDWEFISSQGQLTKLDTLSVSLNAENLTSTTPVTIRSSDKIRAQIRMAGPFMLSHISGVLKTKRIDYDDKLPIELGRISDIFTADSVAVDSLIFKVKFFTAAGYPVDIDMTIFGIDTAGTTIAVMKVPPGGSFEPNSRRLYPRQNDSVVFDNQSGGFSQFISQFLSRGGANFRLAGSMTINPLDVYARRELGVVDDTMQLYSSFDLIAPFRVAVFNGKFTQRVQIGNEHDGEETRIDTNIIRPIKKASMFFMIENAFPMNVNLTATLLKGSDSLLQIPKATQDNIQIIGGTHLNPSRTPVPIRVNIDRNDAQVFNDIDNVILNLYLNSGGHMVQFSPNDYIRIRTYATLVFKIDPN